MIQIQAQSLTLPGGTSINGPTKFTDIGGAISQTIPIAIAIAGFGLLLMIVAAGFELLTSAGDAKKMEKGKQRLTMAIIGFIVIIGSVFIVKAIGTVFGIQEIKQMF